MSSTKIRSRGRADMTTELRHGYAHTDRIRMQYVEQGDGPLVLLCHAEGQLKPVAAIARFRAKGSEASAPSA